MWNFKKIRKMRFFVSGKTVPFLRCRICRAKLTLVLKTKSFLLVICGMWEKKFWPKIIKKFKNGVHRFGRYGLFWMSADLRFGLIRPNRLAEGAENFFGMFPHMDLHAGQSRARSGSECHTSGFLARTRSRMMSMGVGPPIWFQFLYFYWRFHWQILTTLG